MAREENRRDRIREVLDEFLEDGESLVVSRDGDEIEVRSTSKDHAVSPLRETHPELFATLLRANARIDDAGGCALTGFPAVILWIVIAVVDLAGLAEVLRFDLIIVTGAVGLWVGVLVESQLEKRAYRAFRDEIFDAIRLSGLTLERVLVDIQGDADVEDVDGFLKKE